MRLNVFRHAVAADESFRGREAALNSTVRVWTDVSHGRLLRERSNFWSEAHVV